MYADRVGHSPSVLLCSPDWDIGRRVFELVEPMQQHPSLQIAFALIVSDDGDMINDDGGELDKACGLFDRV